MTAFVSETINSNAYNEKREEMGKKTNQTDDQKLKATS